MRHKIITNTSMGFATLVLKKASNTVVRKIQMDIAKRFVTETQESYRTMYGPKTQANIINVLIPGHARVHESPEPVSGYHWEMSMSPKLPRPLEPEEVFGFKCFLSTKSDDKILKLYTSEIGTSPEVKYWDFTEEERYPGAMINGGYSEVDPMDVKPKTQPQ